MAIKDKNDFDIGVYLSSLEYKKNWGNYPKNDNIKSVLSNASKKQTNNQGFPDYIYINEDEQLLIIVEIKPNISLHSSSDNLSEPIKYAVDGVKHYLKFFLNDNLQSEDLKAFFRSWKILGVAVSGDLNTEYNHRVSTFVILNNRIQEQSLITNILNERDYLSLFDNFNEEKLISEISTSSKKVNKWLRSVDSQKRPILLSALMICLFERNKKNDFRNDYNGWSPSMILNSMSYTIKEVLSGENIPESKINILIDELASFKNNEELLNDNSKILIKLLNELKEKIIPLFKKELNYDVIGKFYEEFLRYAGLANVKKGIVLTPRHITELFTELIDLKSNDIILDSCCGTGAFLIAAMNKLTKLINSSQMSNKSDKINKLKKKQLIGFESNSTMFSLAISNMLFRGDGKSQIFKCDYFSKEADIELENLKNEGIIPTIGFINPPYGGKDNKDDPTKKEIQFLQRLISHCSRYVVVIAPLSTYFKDDKIRKQILTNNTLKYVINMPKELFMPNAATNTAIAVFETNKPHANQEVVFYDLDDDGFVLSKAKGRTDTYNKWNSIKSDLLKRIFNADKYQDGLKLVKTKIKSDDEWLIQAHSMSDYNKLNVNDFVKVIKDRLTFNVKFQMNLFDKDIDEITLFELMTEFYGKTDLKTPKSNINLNLDSVQWAEFYLDSKNKGLFTIERGDRLIKENRLDGNIPLVTAGYQNQGISNYIENEEMDKYSSCLTIDMFCNCFYRDYVFCCDDNIIVLKPNFKLNKYVALFILTLINKYKFKFSYGRQYRLKHVQKHKIKLPVDKLGHIDFEFIEKFIKSLPYSSCL